MDHSILDFINADISITAIERVWHYRGMSWQRPKKMARTNEGLLFFIEGGIGYDFGEFTFDALPGQVLRLPSGIPYNGHKLDSDPNHFYCVDFLTAAKNEFYNLPLPMSFTPSDPAAVIGRFRELEECWRSQSVCSTLDSKRMLNELFVTLIKDYAFNICRLDYRSSIMRYCDYLRKNSRNSWFSIEMAAREFHISGTQLRRVFKSELGVSPSEYLAALRIDMAKKLLLTRPDLPISAIADDCGYSSVYYFSAAFRKAVSVTPSEFRREALT